MLKEIGVPLPLRLFDTIFYYFNTEVYVDNVDINRFMEKEIVQGNLGKIEYLTLPGLYYGKDEEREMDLNDVISIIRSQLLNKGQSVESGGGKRKKNNTHKKKQNKRKTKRKTKKKIKRKIKKSRKTTNKKTNRKINYKTNRKTNKKINKKTKRTNKKYKK